MPVHYRFAEIDGLRVFYREAGERSNKTIVLLHGFPSSSHMYRDLIPKLAARYHVVAPDYPGFGYSDAPPADEFGYRFDKLAEVTEKLLFESLGLKKFSIYVQDYGAPVGFRIAVRHPEAIEGIVVQNGNAYPEGLGAPFEGLKPFWANRNEETEKPVRWMLSLEATKYQYLEGAREPGRVSPDSYTFDQMLLDRPGNDAIQLALFHDYQSNVARYPEWHAYLRAHQPRMLVVWGKGDPFFTVEGAKAYRRDVPEAELHLLDAGHFALEEEGSKIAGLVERFLAE